MTHYNPETICALLGFAVGVATVLIYKRIKNKHNGTDKTKN